MSAGPFTAFDLAVLGVVGLSALLALARGAVREVLGLATWIGAVAVAFAGFLPARPLVGAYIQEPLIADAATLALVFLVPFVLLRVLATLVARLVVGVGLGPLDSALGLAFGALRGVLIVCAAYLVLAVFIAPERQPAWVQNARLLPQVQRGAKLVASVLPEHARMLGELIQPADASPPASGPEAAADGPGYTDVERGDLDRLAAPRP
jgi:membrane protein required for colicin V production